jgi:UDP-N-acetylglucosamine 2-epimerase (non-hydrolysing)
MPEEINRIVTDRLTKLYLTPSKDGDENLLKEGADPNAIVCVGNCMIDSVRANLEVARQGGALDRFGVSKHGYALATLHRPSNVDTPARLARLVEVLSEIGGKLKVIFPVHPRTRARLEAAQISEAALAARGLLLGPPLGYLDFLQLQDAAKVVITDSGGVQEETTALGVPCLTVRDNTERPITITEGTNKLVGSDPGVLPGEVQEILAGREKRGRIPALWDGKAGERAAAAIRKFLA